MKAIGKITRDDFCTHSLVPYLFDKGHFKSKQEVLNGCIRARHGENIRTPQTLRQRTGDVLEKPLIQECMKRLGIDKYEDKITEKVIGSINMPSLSSPALPTAQPKAAEGAGGFSLPKF